MAKGVAIAVGAKTGSPCTVCQHPKREAADLALAAGQTATRVAATFSILARNVQRHRRLHLSPSLARAAEAREELGMDSLVRKLQGYVARLERGMEKAETKSDLQNLGRLVKESTAILVRLGQLKGAWSDRPIIDNRRLEITTSIASLSVDELRSYLSGLQAMKMLPKTVGNTKRIDLQSNRPNRD